MQLPDELWAHIRTLAEARLAEAVASLDTEITQIAQGYATDFIDVTNLSDDSQYLMHKATGRVLKIKAEWDG